MEGGAKGGLPPPPGESAPGRQSRTGFGNGPRQVGTSQAFQSLRQGFEVMVQEASKKQVQAQLAALAASRLATTLGWVKADSLEDHPAFWQGKNPNSKALRCIMSTGTFLRCLQSEGLTERANTYGRLLLMEDDVKEGIWMLRMDRTDGGPGEGEGEGPPKPHFYPYAPQASASGFDKVVAWHVLMLEPGPDIYKGIRNRLQIQEVSGGKWDQFLVDLKNLVVTEKQRQFAGEEVELLVDVPPGYLTDTEGLRYLDMPIVVWFNTLKEKQLQLRGGGPPRAEHPAEPPTKRAKGQGGRRGSGGRGGAGGGAAAGSSKGAKGAPRSSMPPSWHWG